MIVEKPRRTLALLQTVAPDYRVPLFRQIQEKLKEEFSIICGLESFAPALWTAMPSDIRLDTVINHFLFRRNLLFQNGALQKCQESTVLIAEFGVRILSTWLICIFRRFRRRPTVFWGHVTGRYDQARGFRHLMMKLADGFICYSSAQKQWLSSNTSTKMRIWTAFNSCMSAHDCWVPEVRSDEITNILFVGRLVKEKKLDILLRAFLECVNRQSIPDSTRLIIVGAGPNATELKRLASSLSGDRIQFPGHINSISELRKLYARSFVAVSPGPIGLFAIQSLGFGIPIIVADDEAHGPEIEACLEGQNAVFFPTGDWKALAVAMEGFFNSKETWRSKRISIQKCLQKDYTYESMAKIFIEVYETFSRAHKAE